MSAWTITALTRLRSLFVADARLSLYVDTFAPLALRLRDSGPGFDFTRHAIQIAAGGVSVAPSTVASNVETIAGIVRLWMVPWTLDESLLLTSDNVAGGVGANGVGGSEVGILQFAEDVRNAVILTELDGGTGIRLVEPTGLEMAGYAPIHVPPLDDLDHVVIRHDIPFAFQHVGYMDPALR